MNRKDNKRYKVAPYMVDDEGISEDGHVCDARYMENGEFKRWITKELDDLKLRFNELENMIKSALKTYRG